MPYEMNGGGPRHIVVNLNEPDGQRWFVVKMRDSGNSGAAICEAVGESTAFVICAAMNGEHVVTSGTVSAVAS